MTIAVETFRQTSDGIPEIDKAPHADLDYFEDWSGWLASGERISDVAWDISDGIIGHAQGNDGRIVTTWLSGGVAGEAYLISATITTTQGRTDTRSFRVRCRVR